MSLIAVVLLGVIVLVGAALVLTLNEGGMDEGTVDHSDLGLPDGALTADDIPKLRFRTGLRGYRMEDVDAALDRITETLRASQGGTSAAKSTTRDVDPQGAER